MKLRIDIIQDLKQNAKLTAGEIKNRFEIIKNTIDRGEVRIIPAYYNLDTGKVDFFRLKPYPA